MAVNEGFRVKVRVRERGHACWCDYRVLDAREVVETLLDKKSDDTVGVKNKIPTCSVLVSNHSDTRQKLALA